MTIEERVARRASWADETIDLTTTAIEEIHKSIAEVPLEVMRRSGFFEKTADDVGELQERSISAVYGAVRDVNRRICGLGLRIYWIRPRRIPSPSGVHDG